MTWFDFHSRWSWGQNIFNSMLTCGDLSCMRSAVDRQRDFRLAQVWPSQDKATWLESSPQVSKRRSILNPSAKYHQIPINTVSSMKTTYTPTWCFNFPFLFHWTARFSSSSGGQKEIHHIARALTFWISHLPGKPVARHGRPSEAGCLWLWRDSTNEGPKWMGKWMKKYHTKWVIWGSPNNVIIVAIMTLLYLMGIFDTGI